MDAALDPAVLDELRQLTHAGEPDVLADVLRLFLADAPGRLNAIAASAEAGDAAALRRAAHTFKGAAAAIGAWALQAACRDLEILAGRPDLSPGDADLSALRKEFDRVQTAIDLLL